MRHHDACRDDDVRSSSFSPPCALTPERERAAVDARTQRRRGTIHDAHKVLERREIEYDPALARIASH